MKVINIQVSDKLKVISVKDGNNLINSTNPVKIASGNYKSVLLNFSFDKSIWNSETLKKYATFTINEEQSVQVAIENIEGYESACYLPYRVSKQNCKVNIGVYGMEENINQVNKIISTESLYFLVVDGAFNIFLTDETPVKITELSSQVKADTDSYFNNKKKDFNDIYQQKINLLKSGSYKIEESIKSYFALTPDENIYTVKFPLWATSNNSAGVKLGANKDKIITPATGTTEEINNYSNAWQSYDVNAIVEEDGTRKITAVKGMSNFKDTGKVDVFCLFRTYYQKIWESNGYLYISRSFIPRDGYDVVPQAKNKDGSISPWFLIGKYYVGEIEGKLYSSKWLIPSKKIDNPVGAAKQSISISYGANITEFSKRGKYYTASTIADYTHILTTFYLQFATRNTQSIFKGNTNNNYQFQVITPERDSKRVILSKENADNIDLNTLVSIGDVTGNNLDRNNGYIHSIANNVRVIGKENIDSNKVAIVLNTTPFTTTSNSYLTTMVEKSGFSDSILGRTGTISNNGKHGFVFNGIEMGIGSYEVLANIVLDIKNSSGTADIYYTNDAEKLTTNTSKIKTTYKKSKETITPLNSRGTNYITEYKFDTANGIAIATGLGTSGAGSTVGYADGYFTNTDNIEMKQLVVTGNLSTNEAAGLTSQSASAGLNYSHWSYTARLSINAIGDLD